MPLWIIYHPPEVFYEEGSKAALSAGITNIYTSAGLPAFYVVVQFVCIPGASVFVGGTPRSHKPFIRITVDHMAIHANEDAKINQWTTSRVDAALKPHIADQGYDWEYHVDETSRELWKINGLAPPPWKSEAERWWARENRPLEWEKTKI
ncbi:hypothetical protein ACJ41O_012496 [Fusarium nematophilum]